VENDYKEEDDGNEKEDNDRKFEVGKIQHSVSEQIKVRFNTTYSAVLQQTLLAQSLFKKERMSFIALCKGAIALLKRENERSLFLSLFSKDNVKNDCSFAFSKRAKMSKKLAIFQIAHFSLKKRAIPHYQYEQILGNSFTHLLNRSSLIFKRVIVQSLAQSLFKKEQMSNCAFCCSLQKSKRAIALCRSFEKSE